MIVRRSRSPLAVATPIAVATREVWRADRSGSMVAFGIQVVGALAALGVVAAGKMAFDALLQSGTAPLGLAPALLLLAFATAISGSMGAIQVQAQRLLGENVAQRIWDRILTAAARVDMITYESTGFATQLERVQQNAVNRPGAVTSALLGLLGGALSVVALSAVLAGIEPILLPILMAAGLPAVVLSRRVSRLEFAFAARLTPLVRRRFYLRQLLSQRRSAAELRAFGSAGALRTRHERLNHDFVVALRSHVRRRQVIALLTTLGMGVALATALLAIVELVGRGRITLSEAGAAAIAVRLLSGQLTTAFTAIGNLQEAAPFLVDIDEFVASAPPAAPPGRPRALGARLAMEGVTFRYPQQSRGALDDVWLTIGAGEVVALVGENGSGKTTLAKIVAGLYEPGSGTVSWDGEILPAADVRSSVSVVFQDFVRYQMTVRDNIVIGETDRLGSDDEVASVAERAGLASTIRDLPSGLDSMLGRELDEGVDLSGGQWQRLALARALYRNRSLVVLDEPTAALDPRAEVELFRDVRAVLGGRAALLISHRFSSVRLADRIYVLQAGRIVECGTHNELIAAAGQYAELYGLQSAAYR